MVVQTTIVKLPSSVEEIGWPSSKMTARAALICRQNSHPFQDRTLLLDQPVKVGRSVARGRPAVNNAIFDCKVLSRNHALLWYENGKFYLQDTKSSNGTFVNNQRLSKGSEESPPREVCSGDIVQFGVDVMENSLTHGCIVATLKIYLPDGKEAKASPSTAVLPPITSPGTIPTQELYQLAQYLQEALHREQLLENKLATLQKLVANSREASESGWKALIDEDRLLTRLEILESQLQTYSKNFGEDKLREEVSKLQDDKNNYQISAKESLMKVLQEKLETMRKLQDVEHNLGNTEFECVHVREMYAKTQVDFQEMATKYNNQIQELQELTEKLQEAQRKHDELTKTSEEEKASLQSECDKLNKEEEALKAKIESLQADNDYTHQQLTAAKARLESARQGKLDGDTFNDVELKIAPLMESQETQVDLLLERIEGDMECNLKGALRHTEDEVTKLKRQLQVSEKELMENKDKVNELQKQLRESNFADENVGAVTKHLQEEILRLEEELKRVQSSVTESALILCKNGQNQENGSNALHNHVSDSEANLTNSLKAEIEELKELLAEAREKKKSAELDAAKYKGQLDDTCNLTKRYTDESAVIRQQLQIAQQLTKEKSEVVTRLQEQLSKAEASSKQQVAKLQDKLAEEVQRNKNKIEETNLLKQQLLEAQQNNKQFHNEAEKLRNQIKVLMEQVDVPKENSEPNQSVTDRKNSDLYLTLKEDCASLRNRIHMVEAELRKTRNENTKLMEDYTALKAASVHDREAQSTASAKFRDELEDGEEEVPVTEEAKKQLTEAENEILQLRMLNTQSNEEKGRLKDQLQTLDEEYRLLLYQTRTIWRNIYILLGVISAGMWLVLSIW